MRTFMVAVKEAGGDPVEVIGKLDKEQYPETYSYIDGKVWFVAAKSPTATPSDLVELLGERDIDFVVVLVDFDEVQGYTNVGLWQKLNAWEGVRWPR